MSGSKSGKGSYLSVCINVSQTRNLGAKEKRRRGLQDIVLVLPPGFHSSCHCLVEQPITQFPDRRPYLHSSSSHLFSHLWRQWMPYVFAHLLQLIGKQLLYLFHVLTVIPDAPASFTVVELGISSQISASYVIIMFAFAYFLIWNLRLTLRIKLITRAIRLRESCCAREVGLRRVNPYLLIQRTT